MKKTLHFHNYKIRQALYHYISFIIILDGSISEVLNKLTVRVISEDECKNSFGNIIHKTTMCAVGVEKGSGTCQV